MDNRTKNLRDFEGGSSVNVVTTLRDVRHFVSNGQSYQKFKGFWGG